jgi:hypothetical protein
VNNEKKFDEKTEGLLWGRWGCFSLLLGLFDKPVNGWSKIGKAK